MRPEFRGPFRLACFDPLRAVDLSRVPGARGRGDETGSTWAGAAAGPGCACGAARCRQGARVMRLAYPGPGMLGSEAADGDAEYVRLQIRPRSAYMRVADARCSCAIPV
jgi:hypothetical protein